MKQTYAICYVPACACDREWLVLEVVEMHSSMKTILAALADWTCPLPGELVCIPIPQERDERQECTVWSLEDFQLSDCPSSLQTDERARNRKAT